MRRHKIIITFLCAQSKLASFAYSHGAEKLSLLPFMRQEIIVQAKGKSVSGRRKNFVVCRPTPLRIPNRKEVANVLICADVIYARDLLQLMVSGSFLLAHSLTAERKAGKWIGSYWCLLREHNGKFVALTKEIFMAASQKFIANLKSKEEESGAELVREETS